MKPYGGEGLLARSLRAPRVRADYSFRTALMTRECLGWFLASTVAASHGAVMGCAGRLANQLAGRLADQLANQPANQFADQLADQPVRKAHELRLANFSLYSADAVPSANMGATEKTPFVGAERPLAGDAPGARRPQTCQPRARGSRTYQLAQPRRGHSRQREFSVAFGEKARGRWAARPG